MSHFLEDSDRELFRDNFKKFLDKEIEPYYEEWEKEEIFPRDVWNKLGENGFLCVDVPEEYGGYGADFRLSAVVVEELSRAGYGALCSSVSVHADIVAPYVLHLGSEEQKQYWLPKLVSGEAVGAIAMTEPGAGSDLQGMRTSAVKQNDQYVINGQKTFITNGQHCDLLVAAAKTDPNAGAKGITLFAMDCASDGFQRGRNLEKMGLHSGDTSELFFDNIKLAENDVLGGVGKGFFNLMNELPRERLILGIGALAACEGMLEWTVDYTQERKAFNQSVSQFQNTRFKLADLKTQIEVNKAYVEKCIQRYDQQQLTTTEASMVKLSTTELQCKVADECLQLFGGYGYMREYKISRAYVDARIQRIYGGTSEVMKEIVARDLVGR